MKYKINNYIVDAESPVEALKISKLVNKVKDSTDFKKVLSGWEKDWYTVRDKFLSRLSKEEINKINIDELAKYLEECDIGGMNTARQLMENLKMHIGDSKVKDLYSYKELMSMLVGTHPNKNGHKTDIYKVDGKYCTNPNTTKERFNTIEEVKKKIEMSGNDSCNDEESNEEKIRKAQEWVDYDIKHHGEVSELTKRDIKKMGLNFDEWDNQVTDSVKDDESFNVGDKVLHISQNERGTVEKVLNNGNVYIRWDGYIISTNGSRNREVAGEYNPSVIRLKKLSDSAIKDTVTGMTENGVTYWNENNYFVIRHKDGRVEKIEAEKFNNSFDEFRKYVKTIKDSAIKDDDITELTEEEYQAIEDYRNAISNTKDPKLLRLFSHILQEETEHIEELENNNVEDKCSELKDERLSPMTYKKLRELGYNENQWKNWTQERANSIIASKKQGETKKQENTTKKVELTAEQKKVQKSINEELKDYFDEANTFKVKKMGWSGDQAIIEADDVDKAYKEIKNDYAYNDVKKVGNKVVIKFDLD